MRYQENDLLEQTLALAEAQGAAAAADFLARERAFLAPGDYPQVYYFLACLAGRSGDSVAALDWLEQAVDKNGWFYRAEVLRDDDLAALCGAPRFERLLRLCARRRAAALESACCAALPAKRRRGRCWRCTATPSAPPMPPPTGRLPPRPRALSW